MSRNSTAVVESRHRGQHWPQCLFIADVRRRGAAPMLASPISIRAALYAILSMITSAWTQPPSLNRQSFFLNCVQKTIEAGPAPQLLFASMYFSPLGGGDTESPYLTDDVRRIDALIRRKNKGRRAVHQVREQRRGVIEELD